MRDTKYEEGGGDRVEFCLSDDTVAIYHNVYKIISRMLNQCGVVCKTSKMGRGVFVKEDKQGYTYK